MSSGIFKTQKTGNYTTVNNEFINDPGLTAKAKGILLYLLSKPDNWETRTEDILNHMADGIDSIKSGLKELQASGYMVRRKIQGARGRFIGWETLVYEVPLPKVDLPTAEKPLFGESPEKSRVSPKVEKTEIGKNRNRKKPKSENPPLLNTDLKLNTDLNKKYVGSEEELSTDRVGIGTSAPALVEQTDPLDEDEWIEVEVPQYSRPSEPLSRILSRAKDLIGPETTQKDLDEDRYSADNFSKKEKKATAGQKNKAVPDGWMQRFDERFWSRYPGTFSTQSKGPKAKASANFRALMEKLGIPEDEIYAVFEWDLKNRQAKWDLGQFAESFPHASRYLTQVEFSDRRRLWKEFQGRPITSQSPQQVRYYEPQQIEGTPPEEAIAILTKIKSDLAARRESHGLPV